MTPDLAAARSFLFVPATRPERIGKALDSGADFVIIDLEDAVAVDDKDSARAALAGRLTPRTAVRINAFGTPWFDADLAACRAAGAPALVLPKAEDPAQIARISAVLPGVPVIALVESGAGFANVEAVARSAAVARLAFGSIDLQVDLGIEDDDQPLHYFRSRIVLATRQADLAAPIDGVCTALDDAAALDAELARARRFGFGAKLCIHPKQVAVINAALQPSPEEIAWAKRVVAAAGDGAAARVDGQMVDAPVIAKARRILQRARPA